MYSDYLYISSRDAVSSSDTSSNFRVYLNHPIENKESISLSHFTTLNTIYNVTSSNNHITVDVSSTPYDATLTAGAYTIAQLTAALKTALDGNGSGLTYTVTYSATSFLVTIAGTNNFSLLFATGTTQINEIIGFAATDTSAATSHTGTNAIDLLPSMLFIRISELGSQFNASNHLDRFTFCVPVNVNSGQLIEYNDNFYFEQKKNIHNRHIVELKIEIYDKENTTIDLHGAETNFVFSLN